MAVAATYEGTSTVLVSYRTVQYVVVTGELLLHSLVLLTVCWRKKVSFIHFTRMNIYSMFQ